MESTPEIFAPPASSHEPPIQYLSSAEFDARIPSLCVRIKQVVEERGFDRVVLWLQVPGKSNFWMTLKCWPFLCDIVDEVWAFDTHRDPYGGSDYNNAHLFLDDALFTGEQASKLLVDSTYFQPSHSWNGTNEHTWIVGAMAATQGAIDHISKSYKAGRLGLDSDEGSDSEESSSSSSSECIVGTEVAFAVELMLERPLYYTGFKVPDNFSIPLIELVRGGFIPGIKEENLVFGNGIVRVRHPQPPYRERKYTWKGDVIETLKHLL